jgi:hypothetical protein
MSLSKKRKNKMKKEARKGRAMNLEPKWFTHP